MQAPQSWVDELTSFWTYSPAHHLRLGPDLRVNVSERRSARSGLQLTSWKWPSTTWRCTTFSVDFLVVAASTAVRASGWIDCLGSRARMMLVRVHCQVGAGGCRWVQVNLEAGFTPSGQARPGQARPGPVSQWRCAGSGSGLPNGTLTIPPPSPSRSSPSLVARCKNSSTRRWVVSRRR